MPNEIPCFRASVVSCPLNEVLITSCDMAKTRRAPVEEPMVMRNWAIPNPLPRFEAGSTSLVDAPIFARAVMLKALMKTKSTIFGRRPGVITKRTKQSADRARLDAAIVTLPPGFFRATRSPMIEPMILPRMRPKLPTGPVSNVASFAPRSLMRSK